VAAAFFPADDRLAAVRFRVAAAFFPAVERLAAVRFFAVLFFAIAMLCLPSIVLRTPSA
jgi:hypothetical protein